MLKFEKLHLNAKLPTKLTEDSPFMTIHSLRDIFIRKGERRIMRTGLKVNLPQNYEGRLLPYHMGMTLMSSIVGRAEIFVDMVNKSGSDYKMEFGSPVANLLVESRKIMKPIFVSEDEIHEGIFSIEDISYQIKISKPNDGIIFPGDEKLIFSRLKIFL